jgi:hypothetical protein
MTISTSDSADLKEARQLYAGAGLPFPPIPAELASQVQNVANWIYGTRDDRLFLYEIDAFVDEAVAGEVANYVLFGHSGHGVNSYAIHFYLVRGPLALFVQVGWGGAYMTSEDNEQAAQRLARILTDTKELIAAAESAAQQGKLATGERFIVVLSSFYGSQWLHQQSRDGEQSWNEGGETEVVRAAIDALHR